jgi:hypothetical protein
MTQVTTVAVYTRPNTEFPWHTNSISDPTVDALNSIVLAFRWGNYHGKKTVTRDYTDLIFVETFVWHDIADYDTYKANSDVQTFEPLLAAYYELNGGSEVVSVTAA